MERYLKDIINLNDIKAGKINIIQAPCGAGKTTFAIDILLDYFDKQNVLWSIYLIDTRNGRQALNNRFKDGEIFECYQFRQPDIYTYAKFAKDCEDKDMWEDAISGVGVICDELSACVEFSKIKNEDEEVNIHELALKYLHDNFLNETSYIVAIDATPQKIIDYFSFDKDCINVIKLNGIPKSYKENHIIKYKNIGLILNNLDTKQRGLIYTSRIQKMKEIITSLKNRGINCGGFWSISNENEPMTPEQYKLRQFVLDREQMPDELQVLVINKSTERSININTPVDYVIVDDAFVDVQVQARGRIRNDIDTLYIKSAEAEDIITVPEEYLNIKLYKQDKDVLCNYLNIKEDGKLRKWTTIKRMFGKSGYSIIDGVDSGGKARYSIIKRK